MSKFPEQFNGSTLIFGDGASSGNPGPGGWGTIVAFSDGQVRELAGSEPATTNNRMEMRAILEGLKIAAGRGEDIEIFTDSSYLILGITAWIFGWRRNGWKTSDGKDVTNRDLWEALLASSAATNGKVRWKYVPGHQGFAGNERCDELAVKCSKRVKPTLFQGLIHDYSVELGHLPASFEVPRSNGNGKAKPKMAVFYLSYLSGKLERHSTWAECEARVKGQAGARFKKVENETQAREVLKGWGIRSTE